MLLLDEQHDSAVAVRLRQLGHDVVAVSERPELRGRPDPAIFSVATAEERVVVTENVRDYVALVDQAARGGRHHYGVIITVRERYPRVADARGRLVDALARLLDQHRDQNALSDAVIWL